MSTSPPPPPPAYQAPYSGYGGYEHPQGTTILVLGILSLVVCQLLGPVAWVMGNNAIAEIDRNPTAVLEPGLGPGRPRLRHRVLRADDRVGGHPPGRPGRHRGVVGLTGEVLIDLPEGHRGSDGSD